MTTVKRWTVDIVLDEDGRITHAEARLAPGGGAAAGLHGTGTARCSPDDVNVPEIGDELAAARALSSLSRQLLRAASTDIGQATREDVTLNR